MKMQTLCVSGHNNTTHSTGAVSVPIYQSATFSHPSVGESTGFDYSRLQNPTREHLEKIVCKLENGLDALAFSSGMAAFSTLMELFACGDHIIAFNDLYGGTIRYLNTIALKNNLKFDYFEHIDEIPNLINANTKAIFLETPSNPMMNVIDIEAVSKISKKHNILLIVDNTFLTPYFQQPITLGADIILHSGTKYLCGHNDTLAGFLVLKDAILSEKLRYIHKTMGACLSPFDSWLLIRGVKTLAIRLERQQENAMKIANWLCEQKKIKKVYYTGLPDHQDYNISVKQSRGFGSMISFVTDSVKTAHQILEKIELISFAESLGGVESLITYPMTQTHADVPQSERESKGINDCLLRLSVGIEDVDDLIEDLSRAINLEDINV